MSMSNILRVQVEWDTQLYNSVRKKREYHVAVNTDPYVLSNLKFYDIDIYISIIDSANI